MKVTITVGRKVSGMYTVSACAQGRRKFVCATGHAATKKVAIAEAKRNLARKRSRR